MDQGGSVMNLRTPMVHVALHKNANVDYDYVVIILLTFQRVVVFAAARSHTLYVLHLLSDYQGYMYETYTRFLRAQPDAAMRECLFAFRKGTDQSENSVHLLTRWQPGCLYHES